MSNRFSRNRSRAQPTPHVCKSKHVTPAAPPPFNPEIFQAFINVPTEGLGPPPFITQTTNLSRVTGHDTWTTTTPGPFGTTISWEVSGEKVIAHIAYFIVWNTGNPDPQPSWFYIDPSWIPGQPYNSGLITLTAFGGATVDGTGRFVQ